MNSNEFETNHKNNEKWGLSNFFTLFSTEKEYIITSSLDDDYWTTLSRLPVPVCVCVNSNLISFISLSNKNANGNNERRANPMKQYLH